MVCKDKALEMLIDMPPVRLEKTKNIKTVKKERQARTISLVNNSILIPLHHNLTILF
jgi:hypothetical protein